MAQPVIPLSELEENTLDTESGARDVDVDFARKLIAFHSWEYQRVWDSAIAPLTDDQFRREVKFLRGSVQSECQGIISSESVYLQRLLGASRFGNELLEDSRDRAVIAARWKCLWRAWADFAQELDGKLFYSRCDLEIDGCRRELRLWQLLFDALYQGTSRRSQILRLVAELSQPAEFDLSLLQHLTGLLRG